MGTVVPWNEDWNAGFGIALNEANLLGVEVDPGSRRAAVTLAVLALPAEGPAPADSRVQLVLAPVGRVAVSLRAGRWDDEKAAALPVTVAGLLEVVRSFRGGAIYGWEFIDVHEEGMARWNGRVSLDWESGADGRSHSLSLFQEDGCRHLDVVLWFDGLELRGPGGEEIPVAAFIQGGRRWWDGLYAGDPRTAGRGISPTR